MSAHITFVNKTEMIKKLGELHNGMMVFYHDDSGRNLLDSFKCGKVRRFVPQYPFRQAVLYLSDVKKIVQDNGVTQSFFKDDVIYLQLSENYHIENPLFATYNEMIENSINALRAAISELESLKPAYEDETL